MKKVLEFLRNDHIQVAAVSALCIIILALFFKRLLQEEVPFLQAAVPGFLYMLWESTHQKIPGRFWSKPLPWNLGILLVTALIIAGRAV